MLFLIIISLNNKSQLLKFLFNTLILNFINKLKIKNAYFIKHFKLKYSLKYSLF